MNKILKYFLSLIFCLVVFLTPQNIHAFDWPTLFFDDFNDGNFNGWTVESGNWFVINGSLVGFMSGRSLGGRIDTGNAEWDNYRLELDVNGFQGIDQGLGFRYTENGSYEVNLRYGTGDYDTPQVKLWKNDGNNYISLTDTHSFPLINNKWYHVKIEAFNENIKVWIDNTLIFDFTDPGTNVKKGALTLSQWTGNIGIVDVRFDNIKVTSLAPPKTPLILIPGIGGSELKVEEDTIWNKDDGHGGEFNHIYPKDEKVWVNEGEAANPGEDDYFDVLRMQMDGINSEANLGLTGNLYAGAYQGAIDFFTTNGYTLDQDFFVFPYDWRKDISLTASLLDTKINQIKSQTGAQKVDIVSHSMGGLVARNYIADSTKAQNVRKLFTLGTPHLGTPHFLKVLRYGDCLTRLLLLQQPICIGLTYSEVKDVIRNMISGFQLAPSQAYFNTYNGSDNLHPFPLADLRDIDNNGVTGPLNYSQTKTLLNNLGHNTDLFIPSELFHNLDNNLSNTNGVDVTDIVGSGMATLGQIIEKYKIDFAGVKFAQKEEIKINGDDTVPLLSAAFGATKVFYAKQKHGELPNPGPAMNLIKNILDDNSQIPVGISHDPYPFNGTQVSVHSPVNIHVYDAFGYHTGPLPNGDFEANIPGSSYDTLGDAKFIFLPDDGVYTINFEATDQGNFDFKIRKFENDINSESILYKDIPITLESTSQTVLNTSSSQPPILQIDQNSVIPTATILGNENFDQTPPQVSIDATPKLIWPPNNKMIDVKITGSSLDENLYRTIFIVEDEYSLVEPSITNFGHTIQLQAFRHEDDQDGRVYTIRAIAEDLAGNTAEQKVEIIVPHDQRYKN